MSPRRVLLFISTYNLSAAWAEDANADKICTPIEVGAARRSEDEIMYPLRDDTGDNISADNAYWGELTGMYWLWKNYDFKEGDIVGFCHYNKYLDIKAAKITRYLDKYPDGWIARTAGKMFRYPAVKDGVTLYKEDVDTLVEILSEDWPEYHRSWQKLYTEQSESRDNNAYPQELFYTSAEEYRAYCEFLFGALTKLRERIGDVTDRVPGRRRYLAFMGERLLNVYTLTNHRRVLEVEAVYRYSRGSTIIGKAAKLLHIKKNAYLYVKLRSLLRGPDRHQGSYDEINKAWNEDKPEEDK